MAPTKAAHSLPLTMHPAGFLLPTLAALALASCAASPSAPPPTASVPPPAPQQQATPPATPAQSPLPLLTPERAYGAELSIEAKSRLNLSKEYAQQVIGHLQNAKNAANTEYACDELNKSYRAVQATVSAVDPVQDEIEKKRGREAYSSLLRQSVSTQDEIRKLSHIRCTDHGAAATLSPASATPAAQSQASFISPGEMDLSPSRSAIEQRDREQNEFRAMKANIEATAKQFVLERRLLEARQNLQLLDQQSAIRATEMKLLEHKQKLLELQALCQRVGC